jgi:hypothetical protein
MLADHHLARHLLRHRNELWDAWAFAAVEVQLAFEAWKTAARELKAAAFDSYHAALDREEQAATLLAQACA